MGWWSLVGFGRDVRGFAYIGEGWLLGLFGGFGWGFDIGRGCPLLVVRVVNLSRHIEQLYNPLVIDSSLHLAHRLSTLLLRFILNEQVPWICTNIFLFTLYKPIMHNFSILWESFNQIFMKFLPLLWSQMCSHVGSNSIGNSDQSWYLGSFA